ncbi:CLUMA_CG008944, isoform A [Clunio marinus]|uniref:CLUMA_CG008944, isoform A n=1 Tax=Clunio marinus TaxID=568069 RepID=A0A1J1I5L0_9DIPT|nr:CLUMA_CG008944, isoform A [Clunio marinus]
MNNEKYGHNLKRLHAFRKTQTIKKFRAKEEVKIERNILAEKQMMEQNAIQVNYQLPLEIVKNETLKQIVDQPQASFIEENISNQHGNELEGDGSQNVVVDKDLQSEINKEDKPEELSESKSELPSENSSSKEEIEPVNNVLQIETSPIEEDQPMEVTEEIFT